MNGRIWRLNEVTKNASQGGRDADAAGDGRGDSLSEERINACYVVARHILKNSQHIFGEVARRYAMIRDLATIGHSVTGLCELFTVSAGGYYAWIDREPSCRETVDKQLTEQIKVVHKDSRKTYGSPRVMKALRKDGIRYGKKTGGPDYERKWP